MATDIDICNEALALLGERADVTSISPVEGGRFAERCARDYPIARNLVLEAYPWSFATRRAALAVLLEDYCGWRFGYARPGDALCITAVIEEDDRYFEAPKEFICETESTRGQQMILTNLEDAWCRYTVRVTNTPLLPELVCQAITYKLAGLLAGNILKGTPGQSVAKAMEERYNTALALAKDYDMRQRRRDTDLRSTWTKTRGWRN